MNETEDIMIRGKKLDTGQILYDSHFHEVPRGVTFRETGSTVLATGAEGGEQGS